MGLDAEAARPSHGGDTTHPDPVRKSLLQQLRERTSLRAKVKDANTTLISSVYTSPESKHYSAKQTAQVNQRLKELNSITSSNDKDVADAGTELVGSGHKLLEGKHDSETREVERQMEELARMAGEMG